MSQLPVPVFFFTKLLLPVLSFIFTCSLVSFLPISLYALDPFNTSWVKFPERHFLIMRSISLCDCTYKRSFLIFLLYILRQWCSFFCRTMFPQVSTSSVRKSFRIHCYIELLYRIKHAFLFHSPYKWGIIVMTHSTTTALIIQYKKAFDSLFNFLIWIIAELSLNVYNMVFVVINTNKFVFFCKPNLVTKEKYAKRNSHKLVIFKLLIKSAVQWWKLVQTEFACVSKDNNFVAFYQNYLYVLVKIHCVHFDQCPFSVLIREFQLIFTIKRFVFVYCLNNYSIFSWTTVTLCCTNGNSLNSKHHSHR